ncbi:MAG: hypothetical protein JKY52_08490 [Flavobacteriales bacterium]|nr:hypothetical protein [Flavobacteriales bacterium]
MNKDKDNTDALAEVINDALEAQDKHHVMDVKDIADAVRIHILSDEAINRGRLAAIKADVAFRYEDAEDYIVETALNIKAINLLLEDIRARIEKGEPNIGRIFLSAAMGKQS